MRIKDDVLEKLNSTFYLDALEHLKVSNKLLPLHKNLYLMQKIGSIIFIKFASYMRISNIIKVYYQIFQIRFRKLKDFCVNSS